MVDDRPIDDRSPMAKSLAKVSEIIAICLLMIVPAMVGYFVDQQVGTGFVFTVIGLVIGMFGAIQQLVQLVKSLSRMDKGKGKEAFDLRDSKEDKSDSGGDETSS